MSALTRRLHRALFILVAALMGFSLLAPAIALGAPAPSTVSLEPQAQDATESTPAEDSTTEDTTTEDTSTAGVPWAQPIDYGVVVDYNNALPAEGLACRTAPGSGATVLIRLGLGESVEATGQTQWTEGIEFLPINCAGQGGFVKKEYVQLNSGAAPVDTSTEVTTTEDTSDTSTTNEVAADASQGDNAQGNEAAADAPVAGDLIVTVQDQSGNVVGGACFDLYDVNGWVASTCDSNDAVPNNGNSGFFGIPSGSYTAIASSSPDGVSIENVEARVDAGGSAYVTAYATGGAPAKSDSDQGTDVQVETTEAPATEEPVTEEVATEVPATAEVTEVVTKAAVTQEVAATAEGTEVATEEQATDSAATAEATKAVTEEPAADAPAIAGSNQSQAGVDLSKAIGDATVTGTNGDGVRCRVAPNDDAAVITVLEEGATVFVLEAPANGYIGVACGNQLGYTNVEYMYSGGAGEEIGASVGSVVVVGTGGMALNCRSGAGSSYSVIASVPMGTNLTSRGASINGWAPVVCSGKNGFVSIAYVEPTTGGGTTTPSTPTTTVPSGTTGTVNTGGDNLYCRSTPGGSVVTRVGDGAVLTVRGATSNGWVPVVCGGTNGYVSAQYFNVGGGSTTNPTPTPDTGTGTTSGYVKVTGTGGSSLNCRSAASLSGMLITSIPYGATLAVRGAATNGWTPVNCGGKNGYVSSQYVTSTSGSGTTTPTPTPGTGTGTTGTATVANTDGDGVRCRVSPGGTVITTVAEGTSVTTRGASSGGWTPVVCGGTNGYISSTYLSTGGGSTSPTPTPTTPPGSGSGYAVGDHVKITSRANMRYEASANANLMITVDTGEVLLVRGGVSNGYLAVDYDGLKGYVIVDVTTKTSEVLSERGGSGNEPSPTPTTPTPGGGGSTSGNAVVSYAMRYLGYPYVSATHGPSSFDCSGFTSWVAKNVLGMSIGYGTWTQSVSGTPVSRASLQPGDLVFFQNTYKAGLSHVGIYIGNDQFIHAENETTGVRISSLSSTYYSSRWYGAVRLT